MAEELVAVLDVNPDVVLAYCRTLRTLTDDARAEGSGFETYGITDRAERLRLAARYMLAGDMIYGLMRADALAAAGVFHRVLTPDRQILLALSLFGQFRQVPEILVVPRVRSFFDRPPTEVARSERGSTVLLRPMGRSACRDAVVGLRHPRTRPAHHWAVRGGPVRGHSVPVGSAPRTAVSEVHVASGCSEGCVRPGPAGGAAGGAGPRAIWRCPRERCPRIGSPW